MKTGVKVERSTPLPWKDPLQARPPQLQNGSIAAVYYGQRCSGDFYDFVCASPHRTLFGLFDIAGDLQRTRGIAVALQDQFRSLGADSLREHDTNECEAMLELWIAINSTVMKAASGVHSCPAFLGCYNDELGTICYINAGHTPALVRDQHKIHELEATALPLGLFSHSVPDSSVVTLCRGDALLVVSKGVVEAKFRGEEFGMERVREYFDQVRLESAHETCVGILDRIRRFMRTAPTHNDVTTLTLVRARLIPAPLEP